ncbi:MAG: DNA polymerase III subunit alpha [Prevotellaceae bacterium]|nr:DNA polymerase III subunit alpha [Prevotellaceae bacterium]
MHDFIHLHVHTHYSILDGAASVPQLVDKAVGNGMRGMAITDHGNMFGVKELFNYCKKLNKGRKEEGLPPFVPIFGCEVYVANTTKESQQRELGDNRRYHLILLAKNATGYHNLIKIVSNAWVDGFYGKPRTDHNDIEKYHEGIICSSACLAGEIPQRILEGNVEEAERLIEWYKGIFGEDYYLELMRHEVTNPEVRANRETYPEQKRVNDVLLELAKKHNVKVICTNDSHFVNEENGESHDRLICLNTGRKVNDADRMLYTKQEWFKTREEMNALFADVPESLENTIEILEKCETYDIDHAPIMPNYEIPAEFGTEEEYRQRITEKELYDEFTRDENGNEIMSAEEAEKKIKKLGGYDKLYRIKFEADYLRHLSLEGAKMKYGDPVPENVLEQIKFELHVMKTMGFPGYFLIVQDYINTARKKLDVWVGPGRGSAAGSVVAYCLDITRIDPLKYNLLFERFLNPDRISLPDIDVDFDDDGRGKVLEYVTQKYGEERVAHIITYGTMATKNAIKDVARVQDVPLDIVNRLCKAIPDHLPEVNGKEAKMNIPNVVKYVPEIKAAAESSMPMLRDTMKYAQMLENNVRGTGVHACGVIICGDDITNWVPVSMAEDKASKERVRCTQYDGHVIEDTGLIKMDFLGLKTLSIQKEAVENIKESLDIDLDIDHIDIDDELTYKLYCDGNTVGTFQFESPGMRKYLRELQPSKFEDLIAMNALYRPGPMDYIPQFIKRKHGIEPIEYDIPIMEKYLKDTYGITVYQEQVMLLSRLLANFTRGQSDTLRKAMGKKMKSKMDELKTKFLAGGKENGHEEKTLLKIWADWEKFASYAFNKSHAACYSWVSYQTAYLKAHYPSQYMAAVMSRSLADIAEVSKLMDECKANGIDTLGPDVNESRLNFSVNKHNQIRFGLAAIKGMGASAAESVITEREKNGQYKSVFDFVERVNLSACNRRCVEALIYSGALDSFGIRREQYFEISDKRKNETLLDALMLYGNRYQVAKNEEQNSLFGGFDAIEIATPVVPDAPEWNAIERLNKEKELIGIYLSAHPLDEFSIVLEKKCNIACKDLDNVEVLDKLNTVTFGGIVTASEERMTKAGKPYGRISMEDYNGVGSFALFDANWTNFSNMFHVGYPIYVVGKYAKTRQYSERKSLVIDSVCMLSDAQAKQVEKFTIRLNSDKIDETFVEDLNVLVDENKGTVPLWFDIYEPIHNQTIATRSTDKYVTLNRKLTQFLNGKEEDGIDYYLS